MWCVLGVRAGDEIIAETTAGLLVDEQDHGLVFYVPKGDVRLDLLAPTDDSSRCPYKGDAVSVQIGSVS